MLNLTNLRCEHMHEPYGLDEKKPRFSWVLESDRKNVMQAAYQIVVCEGNHLVWDSGIVKKDSSIEIRYEGEPLKAMSDYQWHVTVWDNHNEQAKAGSIFTTARFDVPWRACWVEPDQIPTETIKTELQATSQVHESGRGVDDYQEFQRTKYLRLEFDVCGAVKRATVYATAHGVYELEVNGKKADDRFLAPEITAYDKMLQYQVYDIKDKIIGGKNVLGIKLADGWWTGRVGAIGDSCHFGNTIGLLLEGVVEYEDGTIQYVCSDDAVSADGPIIFSDIFVGEKYDARQEMTGWNLPGYDASAWKPVNKIECDMENLTAQYGEPVRIIKKFKPKEILHTPAGETVIDLGQNIAGFVEFSVSAEQGTVIKLEHTEILNEEGCFYNNILGVNKEQTDIYIAKEGRQTYHPTFSYHGFRYIRVTGWPGEPKTEDFTACVIATDVEDLGTFVTSNEKLNRLQQNIWWSQVANTISIPTDCPQRERAGWTGDVMVYAATMCYNRRSDTLLTRWLRNCRCEQRANGEITNVVPYLSSYERVCRMMGASDSSCGWGDVIIVAPWKIYQAYGDKAVLEENYDAMLKWMHYVENCAETEMPEGYETFDEEKKQRQKYLWNTGFHYGDWLVPSIVLNNPDASAMMETAYKTKDVVAPAYYAFNTALMAKVAAVLGKEEDQVYYELLNEKIRQAFIEEYVSEDGKIQTDLQGVYVIALENNLVTDEIRPKMVQRLCKKIEENGDCLDTGFLSIPFLMDVLTQNGHKDVAYKLLYQTKCPSWLYEVGHGATTMWESWGAITPDGKVSSYSYNHYAFGCVGEWMYRELAGLQAAEPGYKRIRIAPSYDCGLTMVNASEITPYGQVRVNWKVQENEIKVNVTVPANTSCAVVLPDGSEKEIGSGTYEF